jgi:hypothetical protein
LKDEDDFNIDEIEKRNEERLKRLELGLNREKHENPSQILSNFMHDDNRDFQITTSPSTFHRI